MDDQKQKSKPTKQVRVRVTYTAIIEVVENEVVIHRERKIGPINNFDRQGFEEVFDFLEIKRLETEARIEEEFEREQQAKRESEKTLFQSAFESLTSYFS